MTSVPTPEQQAGFAPRRPFDSGAPAAAAMANGQAGQAAAAPAAAATPTNPTILQRPKVKKEKVAEITAATSKLAIDDAIKLVSAIYNYLSQILDILPYVYENIICASK